MSSPTISARPTTSSLRLMITSPFVPVKAEENDIVSEPRLVSRTSEILTPTPAYCRFQSKDLPSPDQFGVAIRNCDMSGSRANTGILKQRDGTYSYFLFPAQFHLRYGAYRTFINNYTPLSLPFPLWSGPEADCIPTRMLVEDRYYPLSRYLPRQGAATETARVHLDITKVPQHLYPMDPRFRDMDTYLVIQPPRWAVHQFSELQLHDRTYTAESMQANQELSYHRHLVEGLWTLRSSQGFTNNFLYEILLIHMTVTNRFALLLIPPTCVCQDVITEVYTGSDWWPGHWLKVETHLESLGKDITIEESTRDDIEIRELMERARQTVYIRDKIGS